MRALRSARLAFWLVLMLLVASLPSLLACGAIPCGARPASPRWALLAPLCSGPPTFTPSAPVLTTPSP